MLWISAESIQNIHSENKNSISKTPICYNGT